VLHDPVPLQVLAVVSKLSTGPSVQKAATHVVPEG
jgi:hypothetical protein